MPGKQVVEQAVARTAPKPPPMGMTAAEYEVLVRDVTRRGKKGSKR